APRVHLHARVAVGALHRHVLEGAPVGPGGLSDHALRTPCANRPAASGAARESFSIQAATCVLPEVAAQGATRSIGVNKSCTFGFLDDCRRSPTVQDSNRVSQTRRSDALQGSSSCTARRSPSSAQATWR